MSHRPALLSFVAILHAAVPLEPRIRLLLCCLATLIAASQLPPMPAFAGERRFQREGEQVEARILRVKPAVVGIFAEVAAEVAIRCRKDGERHVVTPKPELWNGTGFIIHPDGWIATNGHVVEPVLKDDGGYRTRYLRMAAEAACGPGLAELPATERARRMEAILRNPENLQGVALVKKLFVNLPQRVRSTKDVSPYPASVRAYSPSIDPALLPKDGGKPDPPMWDAAIIKIDAANLPTVRLAPSMDYVHLGQDLFIIGYPGAVLWHDFLSRTSQSEATVTFGRVSSFKDDINGRRILQTDAAISWGNSGGPAFSWDETVIGVATFISTAEDQAIQGFNFLIPVETIHALAGQIGVTPQSDGSFMSAWQAAVTAYFRGRFSTALQHVEAADTILPGFADVRQLREHLERIMREHPTWDMDLRTFLGANLLLVVGAVASIAFGVRTVRKRRRLRRAAGMSETSPGQPKMFAARLGTARLAWWKKRGETKEERRP